MVKATIFDIGGKESGKETLVSEVFEVKPNSVLLKQAVLRYLSGLRSAIAKTKTRAERSGGGKKPWRQKGTGRARTGSRRNPIWRKGGVIFGPTGEENFEKKMNKKSIRLSILMALSAQAKEERIIIVENIKLEKPQTKKLKETLDSLPIKGKILLIFDKDLILFKSASNMPNVLPALYNQLNTFDILNADYIVILKNVLPKIVSVYTGKRIEETKGEEPKKEKTKTKKAVNGGTK